MSDFSITFQDCDDPSCPGADGIHQHAVVRADGVFLSPLCDLTEEDVEEALSSISPSGIGDLDEGWEEEATFLDMASRVTVNDDGSEMRINC